MNKLLLIKKVLSKLLKPRWQYPFKWLCHYVFGNGESLEFPDSLLPELQEMAQKAIPFACGEEVLNNNGDLINPYMCNLDVGIERPFFGCVSFFPCVEDEEATTSIELMCASALMVGTCMLQVLSKEYLEHGKIKYHLRMEDTYDWHGYSTEVPSWALPYLKPIGLTIGLHQQEDGCWYFDEAYLKSLGTPFLTWKEFDVVIDWESYNDN